jgi:ABC-type nitrate/sulfonate/bicarbonate transport system ATPase subunit
MSNNQIQIKNLTFGFSKDTDILSGINLSIAQGEFLSILGASGSGKSTLLRIISNILPTSKTEVPTGDVSIFGKTPKAYLDTGKLSFMFQEASLMPNLNVKDNIGFPLKLRGKEIETDFINELLDIVGLTEHQGKYPSELSGGMKTRVSLARAFVTKPELLLLDEPFSALDVSWRYELYEYLELLALQYKTTVILVTHDIQESILLGNNVTILSKGGYILDTIQPIENSVLDYGYESVNKVIELNTYKLLDIQTKIIVDGTREDADLKRANTFADYLFQQVVKNEDLSQSVLKKVQVFNKSINDKDLFEKLYTIWKTSNQWELKQELMWRLLDSDWATDEVHKKVYDFITSDMQTFAQRSQKQQYFQPSEIFHNTTERLNNGNYPTTKDWLYLVYLKAMTDGDKELEIKSENLKNEYLSTKKTIPYIEYINAMYNDNKASLEK